MRLNLAYVTGIEFVVDQGMQQDFALGAIHGVTPSAAFHAERSMERARASRDITVPTGHTGDLRDLLIGQIVDFTQYDDFTKLRGQFGDQLPNSVVVVPLQQRHFR